MKRITVLAAAMLLLISCNAKYNEGEVRYSIWTDCQCDSLPSFETLGRPDTTGVTDRFRIDGKNFPKEHFAALYKSTLRIDIPRTYEFYIRANDGARLYVDGTLVLECVPNGHNVTSTGRIYLDKGRHNVRVEYFQKKGNKSLKLLVGDCEKLPREWGGPWPYAGTPDFVATQAEETFERFRQWKGDDQVVVFPILTDLHSEERYTYQHIGFIAGTIELFNYDFMAVLGDIGINNGPGHVSKDYVGKMIAATKGEMAKFPGVVLYAAGNHDWDAGEGDYHSAAFLSDTFQAPALEYADGNLHLVPGEVYCYYDIPEKDVRVIILNSQGSGTQGDTYYIYDDAQVKWLRSVLDATPRNTSIILFSHYQPHPLARWHNTPADYTLESNENMMRLLEDYATRRRIVGLLCGDSHFNLLAKENGVNYYVTQSYGWCNDSYLMPTTTHEYYDWSNTLCCDIVAVKPALGVAKSFRMGAGGAKYDVEFEY